jgi:hypothetical protein
VPEQPGATRETPVYTKMLRDDKDQVDWGRVVVGLGLTVLTGYLAAKSQRWGSNADLGSLIKMKLASLGQDLGQDLCRIGCQLSRKCAKAYDNARPL